MRGGKGCLPHTMQSLGHAFPALCRVHVRLNGVLLSLRPSLPGLRRRPSFVVRLVHRYYGTVRTSPARSCPPFGLWPSRTGLDRLTKTYRRSPGSRACCFSACAGFLDYAGPTNHSRLTWLSCCLPPYRNGVGILFQTGFSKLNRPAHRYLCLRFKRYLAV